MAATEWGRSDHCGTAVPGLPPHAARNPHIRQLSWTISVVHFSLFRTLFCCLFEKKEASDEGCEKGSKWTQAAF
jgi:hypothetical protein